MLATADHEGNLVLWTLSAGRWSSRWSEDTSARGWRGVRRLQWARGGKLLVCGQMALAHRAELIVLQFDEDYNAHVSMRAGCACGEGGGAGWAGGPRRVLSVELRRLAASQYVSTVWVNAASQETQSEFAGVRSPVLQIYNEQCTCITHLLVAEVPLDAQVLQCAAEEDQLEVDEGPCSEYFRAMKRSPTANLSTLVCGVCGGAGRAGQCGAVAAWWLGRDQLTPRAQRVEGDLRQRRAARLRERQEAQQAQGDPPEPDEASVRAMCSPPDDLYELGGALLSLALHESQSLVWAYTHGAATCLCLPGLRAVRRVRLPALPGQAGRLGHAQMDVGHCVVAAPLTDGSGGVCVWGGSSGAAGRTLAHRAPPAAALLPARCPGRPTVVVLAGNCIHVWRRRVPCILRTMGQDYS